MQPYQTPETESEIDAQAVEAESISTELEPVFFIKSNAQIWGGLSLAVGILLIFGSILSFLVHLFVIDAGDFAMHATTTLPTLGAVALISAGVRSLLSPKSIQLTEQGIQQNPGKLIQWSDIAVAMAGEEYPVAKSLRLLEAKGKTLAKLTDSIEGSERLFELVKQRVKQGSDKALADRIRLKKARKTALMCFVGSVVLGMAAVFMLADTYTQQQRRHRLDTAAVDGEGVIEEKFLAPDGRTTRIRYSFGTEFGDPELHNVEVEKELYHELAEGQTIAVRYDPQDPEIVELSEGQVDSSPVSPVQGYLVSAVILILCPIVFVAGVLLWKGLELKADDKGVRLVRVGEE